ncbi:hypothetical protein E1200_32165 [Actinomadura sp. GC306]|uniref:hypothetical protein n=1 Tax=Actinomadura sp. GC306 TaxID=2530367 RepID=UPI0010461C52|nr:hypothetical protein [Actinomadura sp. GC306]TDC59390.1 hypothetical protein E1200_32165 [Actinomadura sp. GC306]
MRLNRRESGLLMGALLISVLLWAPFLVIMAAARSDGDELVPQRTPLADLCIWFPPAEAARLVPEARAPVSQAIFYGEVQCDWASADDRTQLGLSAYRPSGALTAEKEAAEVRDFYDGRAPDEGEPAGIGESSVVGVRHGSDYTEAHVIVRDGLLVAQVTYRVPGKGTDVAGKAREAAAELMRLLPPKGR